MVIDPSPLVFIDEIGQKIVGEDGWRSRDDMNPHFSKSMRASIVGRARFIEDLVEEQVNRGTTQYVILGAGLDTFVQRRPEVASRVRVFEVDQPGPQAWKQKRLIELGFNIPPSLNFVPVDFEKGQSWWDQLIISGFDLKKPAIVVSTGVSMYLTKEANRATFKQVAGLATGSTFASTFMLTLDILDSPERSIMEFVMQKAEKSGTPFLSLYSPQEILELSHEAGFLRSQCYSGNDIFQQYFAQRTDGLNPGNAEAFVVARS